MRIDDSEQYVKEEQEQLGFCTIDLGMKMYEIERYNSQNDHSPPLQSYFQYTHFIFTSLLLFQFLSELLLLLSPSLSNRCKANQIAEMPNNPQFSGVQGVIERMFF
ncbi:hypothetical protein V6N12_048405 [Hibiscus sabdariffa]|uniref:Uncharacterized protein n=1 Tax=Hibiscus sabdariffa TaxID=183260 RepID=A0ABR2EKX9_9ROSI